MIWLRIYKSLPPAGFGLRAVLSLVLAGTLVAVACGRAGKGAQTQPQRNAAPVDSATRVTVGSASDPSRNATAADLGHNDAQTHLTLVDDCTLPQCVGDPTSDLIAAIRTQAGKAQSCYEDALKSTPTLAGRLVVRLRVTHEGRACPLNVASNELAESKTLLPCVRQVMERNYPKPSEGCADLQLPLKFVPEYVDAGAPASESRNTAP